MREWALQDARNRFSAVVNAALDGEPQRVTRRGRPAVVVIAVDEYDRLRRAENAGAPDVIERLPSIPGGGPDDPPAPRQGPGDGPLRRRRIDYTKLGALRDEIDPNIEPFDIRKFRDEREQGRGPALLR